MPLFSPPLPIPISCPVAKIGIHLGIPSAERLPSVIIPSILLLFCLISPDYQFAFPDVLPPPLYFVCSAEDFRVFFASFLIRPPLAFPVPLSLVSFLPDSFCCLDFFSGDVAVPSLCLIVSSIMMLLPFLRGDLPQPARFFPSLCFLIPTPPILSFKD